MMFLHIFFAGTQVLGMISETLNEGEIANMSDLQNSSELIPNQACVAQFSEDHLWYRSSVVRIVDDKHIEVRVIPGLELFQIEVHVFLELSICGAKSIKVT